MRLTVRSQSHERPRAKSFLATHRQCCLPKAQQLLQTLRRCDGERTRIAELVEELFDRAFLKSGMRAFYIVL